METQMLWGKRREWMLDQLYLIAFGLFVGYCFLTTTMFRIEWSGMESANIRIIILVIIFARILCSDKIKNKEFSLLMFFVISLLILWRNDSHYIDSVDWCKGNFLPQNLTDLSQRDQCAIDYYDCISINWEN